MADAARRPGWGTISAILFALIILLSLGTWQVFRLQWKEALIAEINTRSTATPMALSDVEAREKSGAAVDYVRMTATGHFEHQHEQYFFNTDDGEVGYHVYTPLILPDGRTLFVNRGFVPEALKDSAKRQQGQITGEMTITGLARAKLTEKPSWVVPDNEAYKQLYFWKDIDEMAAQAAVPSGNLVPFFLDADATPNPGGWPKGGVTQIDLPNNHLSYAVTWYGLAAVLLAVSALAFRRKAS
ncbi:SURF1 family protein [Rhizobium sp. LjRoot254]|uniref:SURF1 family protein n=1 Tax=Rhizobium sp. LjRoot254 TaxID=3342297 RepID=UPI003ECC628C